MDIGSCIQRGWDVFKNSAVPMIVGTLIVLVATVLVGQLNHTIPFLGLIASVLLTGLFVGGLTVMAAKANRGEHVDVPDVLTPFRDRPGDYLLVGLVMQAGLLACGIGVVATFVIFLFAPVLVAQGDDYQTALGRAKDLSFANLGSVFLLALVLIALNILGALACGIGLVVSLPVTYVAIVEAFDQLQRKEPPQSEEHILPP